MCEYCEGWCSPMNTCTNFGFQIENNIINFFHKDERGLKDILFTNEIKYCPFCKAKLKKPNVVLGEKEDLWDKT